jgi:hypothetical protein
MHSIFISYRRSDSQADAGRIYDRLAEHFGESAVFKDVDDIPPGVDFRDYLKATLYQCSVVVAVIGPTWLSTTDEQGKRRLDNPTDWVRVEIQEALKRKDILVVPLLVGHAAIPKVDELPDVLKDLTYRNYREVRPDPDFRRDMSRLIKGLDQYFEHVSTQQQEQAEVQRKQKEAETERQQEEAERKRREEFERQKQTEAERQGFQLSLQDTDDVSSERFGANYYAKLRDLLAAQNWKAADRETAERMREVANCLEEDYLRFHDFEENVSSKDLCNVDNLWVKYSRGKFGFSVQKEIWQRCSSPDKYGKDWEKFGDIVGWKDTKGWLSQTAWYIHRNYTFDINQAPRGHLPATLIMCFPGNGNRKVVHGNVIWGDLVIRAVRSLFRRDEL